ncbi:MAG: hypothetical protein JO218_19830 [Burkholderiales bacterium]|nr:hypothetical protein [Burkholderiales bacterium]
MIVKELQPGDSFAQYVNGHAVRFEVIDVRPLGREFEITFRSSAGDSSARYPGRAVITTH